MRLFSKRVALGWLAGALFLSACGASTEDPVTAAQVPFGDESPETAHLGLVREALSKVSLRTDQKTIVDQLAREAENRREPIRQARLALRGAVADQVAAGKIDRPALKPRIDALLASIEESRAADRVAIGRLHDILDENQRSQFVDAIERGFRSQHHERGGREGARKWAADLKLTEDQRDQIRATLRAKFEGQRDSMKEQFRAAREQGRQMLESFRQDSFTPDPSAVFGRDTIGHGIERMIDVAETALPILTSEQRAIAAEKIRTQHAHF